MAIRYLFNTVTTMKEYNRGKWWIDSNIVKPIEIVAENLNAAINDFAGIVSDKYCIDISKSAIRNKSNMYIDTKSGDTKQVGYVITGSTLFDDNRQRWTKQFIDLWINIDTVIDTVFEEV